MNNYLQYNQEINHPQYKERVRYQANENSRDLNGKLDVTCFLMAVEISRLVAENNELKLLLKQGQDVSLDRVNYEMQIRDLMAQSQSLQKNNYLIGSDNERLKKLLQDQEATISRYEKDLKDYDPNWKKELEQKKKQLAQLQQKLGNDDVDDLRNQLNQLKKKCDNYERQFGGKNPEDLQKMLDELRKKAKLYDDLKAKMGGMDPDTLAKKLKDLEKLQNQFGNPDDLLKELEKLRKKAKEADDLKKELDKQQRENERKKNDIDVLNDVKKNAADLQRENGFLNQQLNEFRNKLRDLDQLKADNEQLKDLLRRKDQEIQLLKNQLLDAQRQFSDAQKQLQDAQQQLQDAQRQMNDIQFKLRQAEQKNQALQQDLDNCIDELDHADGEKAQAGQLMDENNKLTKEVDQLQNEKDKLQDENENLRNKMNDLLRQLQDKDNKLKDLQGDLNKKNAELKDLGQKLKDANDKIEWIKKEFGLTDDDLDPKKRGINGKNLKDTILFANIQPSNLLLNYLLLAGENERLGIIIDKYYNENEQLRTSLKASKQKCESIGQQLQQQLLIQSQMAQDNEADKLKEYYENKLVMLTMELSRLKKQCTQSYQSIPITHQQQIRSFSAQNIDSSQTEQKTKKEEDLLCLIVLMCAEVQQLRDANSTLLLRQPEKEVASTIIVGQKQKSETGFENKTYSGYQGENGSQQSYQYLQQASQRIDLASSQREGSYKNQSYQSSKFD